MKRVLVRAATPALLVVLGAMAASASLFQGCLPSPDISGLPPYEGGAVVTSDGAINVPDVTTDSAFALEAGAETGPVESSTGMGTVSGVVVDYTQGNGQGVVPGAGISITVPGNTSFTALSATADLNGLFTVPNVPAGPVQITVTKGTTAPTGLLSGVAFSSTDLVVTVSAGQTLSVFPVLHEGCFQVVPLVGGGGGGADAGDAGGDAGAPGTVTLSSACGRPGAWASLTFDPTSFVNPITNTIYQGASVRIEMIPLAYPASGGAPDLSWSLGLPGLTSPADLLGAAEYRVYAVDPGGTSGADGLALGIRTATTPPISISVPLYTAPTGTPTVTTYSTATATWATDATVTPGALVTASPLQWVSMNVGHFGWWGVTAAPTPTGCLTGTVQQAGVGVSNVMVHAVGTNGLSSSTAVTGANGAFCLDIQSLPDSTAPKVSLTAGAVSASGLATTTPVGGSLGTVPALVLGKTCAMGTGCSPMSSPIALTREGTCVAGNLQADAGGFAGLLQVDIVGINVTAEQTSAGILSSAYIGRVSPTVGTGAFCAYAPEGTSIQLQDPSATQCGSPWNGSANPLGMIAVPTGLAESICSAGGCADAGVNLAYGCGAAP